MTDSGGNRGVLFFQLFPVGLGIGYGIVGKGFLSGSRWWLEALAVGALLALGHLFGRSYLLTGYVRNCARRGAKPAASWFLAMSFALSAGMILIPGLVASLIRRWVA